MSGEEAGVAGNERGGATRRAYQQIRHAIIAGELAPGSMLSEGELAASLGMSRTPVRTALGRLQEDGWVRIYPQRGALVRELTATEIRESAQVRHALETAGVRRAVPALLDELRPQAERSLEDQTAALADGDFARFNQGSQVFHRLFVQLAGNATMLAMYDRLQERQLQAVARNVQAITENQRVVMAEHRQLFQDAWQGDWIAFAAALDAHHSNHPSLPLA